MAPSPSLNTKPLFKLMVKKEGLDLFNNSPPPAPSRSRSKVRSCRSQQILNTRKTVRQTGSRHDPEQRDYFVHRVRARLRISDPAWCRFRVNVFMQRAFRRWCLRTSPQTFRASEFSRPAPIMSDLLLMNAAYPMVGLDRLRANPLVGGDDHLPTRTPPTHRHIEDPIESCTQ